MEGKKLGYLIPTVYMERNIKGSPCICIFNARAVA